MSIETVIAFLIHFSNATYFWKPLCRYHTLAFLWTAGLFALYVHYVEEYDTAHDGFRR